MQCMLFCNLLLACQQTCISMIILMASQLSFPPPFIFFCKPRHALLEHWDALFASMLWWGTRSRIQRTFLGLQTGEVTNRDAAHYHFLPIASSVNKINWAGQPLLQQLFTWPFQASLRYWEHIQLSHSIFLGAVCFWFFPALQMATRPGQDLGR